MAIHFRLRGARGTGRRLAAEFGDRQQVIAIDVASLLSGGAF